MLDGIQKLWYRRRNLINRSKCKNKAHFNLEISSLKLSSQLNLLATSADCVILVWSYDSLKLKGAWCYQNSEIRRFEFLENQLVIISVDAKGYLIFWDLRGYRPFNYYIPFIKIQLKPENGVNLIINNMLLFKISK